jgi:hypothetical protein
VVSGVALGIFGNIQIAKFVWGSLGYLWKNKTSLGLFGVFGRILGYFEV